ELDGPTTGGSHDELDAIGRERLVMRFGGEGDPSYRERIATLPDVVTPSAIFRKVSSVLTPLGIRFEIVEVRGGELPGFVLDLDPLDDPDALLAGGNGRVLHPGQIGFVVVVERPVPP